MFKTVVMLIFMWVPNGGVEMKKLSYSDLTTCKVDALYINNKVHVNNDKSIKIKAICLKR